MLGRAQVLLAVGAMVVVGLVAAGPYNGASVALAQAPATASGARSSPSADEEREISELVDVGLRWGVRREQDLVSGEERERLGLSDTKWTSEHGKIHPDVYTALKKAERPREPYYDILGLAGTVYVEVQLKHDPRGEADAPENKAAIKRLQDRVLSQLTAAEFYVVWPFETLPGILGRVTRVGAEKLAKSPDVVAVRLDDRPMVRPPPRVTSADLAPAGHDGATTQASPPGSRRGKVELDVYRALALHERVFVIVALGGGATEDRQREQLGRGRGIEDAVLCTLTAEHFWVAARSPIGAGARTRLAGYVDADGLGKLESTPNVVSVGLDGAPDWPH